VSNHPAEAIGVGRFLIVDHGLIQWSVSMSAPRYNRTVMRQSIPLANAYRLLNHGPTVLVTAASGARSNLMAAAWAMPLDFDPPKVAVVIDRSTLTRELIEESGEFALQLPCARQADLTWTVGSRSGRTFLESGEDKFSAFGIETFPASRIKAPLVSGCVGWLECRVIAWPQIQQAHDLFLGEVIAAQADSEVFSDGRWHFDEARPELRTLHHLGAGSFLMPGDAIQGHFIPPRA
jgi:flavin reductase (DIM6/NTAB) family NADH-FMN oxidoreductase RutF